MSGMALDLQWQDIELIRILHELHGAGRNGGLKGDHYTKGELCAMFRISRSTLAKILRGEKVNLRVSEADRFWSKVDRTEDGTTCWLWTGHRNDRGYGKAWFQGQQIFAHRAALALFGREVPEGFEVDHLCRNRACVKPPHLEVVTHRENVKRGVSPVGAHIRAQDSQHG